jgi:hypothetical protein
MCAASLFIDVKISPDKKRILEILFKDWADQICHNDVAYSSILNNNSAIETIKVDFINKEDAVAIRLRGIPEEFQKYMEIVKEDC